MANEVKFRRKYWKAPGKDTLYEHGRQPAGAEEYQEVTYANGEIYTFKWNPRTDDWDQVGYRVDTDLADNARKGGTGNAASADESVAAPPTQKNIVTRKPDGSVIADPNPNYQPPPQPPLIRRPDAAPSGGTEAYDQIGAQYVTPQQFEADRLTASDARQREQDAYQRQQDALTRAQQAEANALAAARVAIDRDGLTHRQAMDKLNADLEKIRLQLQQESHALTARSQDISLRGQDVDANVSQRNTDVSAVSAGAGRVLDGNVALLPYLNAPGQIESTNSLMAGGPPVPTQAVPAPFDPQAVYLGAMQAVQQQLPQRYALPGHPVPVQRQQFVLPG